MASPRFGIFPVGAQVAGLVLPDPSACHLISVPTFFGLLRDFFIMDSIFSIFSALTDKNIPTILLFPEIERHFRSNFSLVGINNHKVR